MHANNITWQGGRFHVYSNFCDYLLPLVKMSSKKIPATVCLNLNALDCSRLPDLINRQVYFLGPVLYVEFWSRRMQFNT
jgi:hypothetical protein